MSKDEISISRTSVFLILIAVAVIIMGFRSYHQVDAGKEGVVYNLQNKGIQIDRPLSPGFNWINPITESVVVDMSTQTQKLEVTAEAATKDIQSIKSVIALNYRIAEGKTPYVYQNFGTGFVDTIITPRLQSAYKTSSANYNLNEIITHRGKPEFDTKELINKVLRDDYTGGEQIFIIDGFSIIDIGPDPEYIKAVEATLIAERNVQTAKFKLQQTEVEKQTTITEAEGKAKSMQIQSDSLAKSQTLVSWEAVKKWNGVMPTYYITGSGNTGLLFNIPTTTTPSATPSAQ